MPRIVAFLLATLAFAFLNSAVNLTRLAPAVDIVETHDVVFAEISAGLHFDDF